MLQACMKMYDWTGDDDYISSPTFTNFYKRSTNEYIKRWDLSPDKDHGQGFLHEYIGGF